MTCTRRLFLHQSAGALLLPVCLRGASELSCDVAVIGGGTGGCAAALAALRNGCRVVMTEETDWVGGQLTAQAVPPDEHPWIEGTGGTQLYRDYRNAVREYYRRNYPLRPEHRSTTRLNPGGGSVSALTHEPKVSLAVIEAMLAPYISSGQLIVLLRHKPVSADVDRDRVRAVTVRDIERNTSRSVVAPYFLDATETGELLPLTKTEYVTGFESRAQTGEKAAPETAQPRNMQAFTVCFAVDHRPGEDHTIDKPAQYAFWRDYVPAMKAPWPGKLLSWQMSEPRTLTPRAVKFDPTEAVDKPGPLNLWIYRRIFDRAKYAPEAVSDVTLVNWPQNDYWLGNLFDVPEAEPLMSARHLEGGRQLSLSLLYWMQTEAPRPDGGAGWKGLRIRPDQTGTADGLAKYPYIREARRIAAEFTVTANMVGADARAEKMAQKFADSVGLGSYRIDLHPSSGGDNYIDVSSLPFQIPLGALLPRRVENLMPVAKNIGTTHITNGCYRLHPVEWNIGEAAGVVAAMALRLKETPRGLRARRMAEVQTELRRQGVETDWPAFTPR